MIFLVLGKLLKRWIPIPWWSACGSVSPPPLNKDGFFALYQGRIQDFKLGGGAFKKLRRAEGGAKFVWVLRVKNHDFTPKYHIFSNCGGRRENFWGISCEKSRFYAKKSYFFQWCAPPPGSAPVYHLFIKRKVGIFAFRHILTEL